MEDSLELSKVSGKRKSVSPSAKDDKQRALFQQVKQKFITALLKLQSSQTRQIGIQQIRTLVDQNREPDHLRLYLSVMKTLKIEGTSSSTKEHEILVFSILAEIFKQNLIDPIDKPAPSRLKTCFKIIQILHSYFKQTTNTVQQACARVLIDLGKHVLGAESTKPAADTQTLANLLFSPLASILKSGVDKASQSTASVCINQQIQYWKAHLAIPKYKQILDYVCPQMLAVTLKLNCEYHEIFMALETVIQLKGLQFFDSKLLQFVSKILGVINKINHQKSPQDAGNFNTYMCKVNVCGILGKIGDLVKQKPALKAKLDQLDVLSSLEKATRNRVIQVQMAAAKAIRSWNGEGDINEGRDKRPVSTPKISNKGQIMSLQEARNNKKRERSGSKQQKLKLERELNHMQEDLHKLVKGGWGPHNRANNYVKKNTGVGGGYCSKMEESPSPKLKKSHKEHIDELRKYIKQNSREHGKKDKFVFYQQRQMSGQSLNKKRNNQPNSNLPIDSHKKKVVANSDPKGQADQMEFVLDQSHGDQMVNLPPEQNYKNPYAESQISGRFDTEDKEWLSQNKNALQKINSQHLEGIMDEFQMKQLLDQQKNILEIQSKKNIKSISPGANCQYPSEIKKESIGYGQMTFNGGQAGKKSSKLKPQDKTNNKRLSMEPSKEEGEKKKQFKFMDQGQASIKNQQVDNKQQVTKKSDRQEIIHKQFKQNMKKVLSFKQIEPNINTYEPQEQDSASENMSASIPIADIMNASDFEGLNWNPFLPEKKQQTKPQYPKAYQSGDKGVNKLSGFGKRKTEQPVKDSLVLSLSRQDQSRSKSPPKNSNVQPGHLTQSKQSQLTLNPKNEKTKPIENSKFNSWNQKSDEDEEILDESKYQQSVPFKVERTSNATKVEDFYKITMKHGQELDKRAQSNANNENDRKSEVYQQIIKNPPKSRIAHDSDSLSQQPSSQMQQKRQQQNGNYISESWERVLQLLQNNEINEAYSQVLSMDDPIYLLRLMLKTETPLRKLTPANTCKLWEKFLQIFKNRFIDNLFVQMFSSAQKIGGGRGLTTSLSIEELNQMLIQLYELSGRTKGQLSFRAASLYNQVEDMTNKKRG